MSPILGMSSVSGTPWLSVVIPVRNEEQGAGALLSELRLLTAAGCEVIVVDNGSTDRTADIFGSAPAVRLVRCDTPGFGAAVKAGLACAAGEYVAWLPGNLRVRPSHALVLAAELVSFDPPGTAFVKARRLDRPWKDRITTAGAGLAVSLVARCWLPETGGTPTVVHHLSLPMLLSPSAPDDLGFESWTLWRLRKAGQRRRRYPVAFHPRPFGTSRWNAGLSSQLRLLAHLLRTVPRYQS